MSKIQYRIREYRSNDQQLADSLYSDHSIGPVDSSEQELMFQRADEATNDLTRWVSPNDVDGDRQAVAGWIAYFPQNPDPDHASSDSTKVIGFVEAGDSRSLIDLPTEMPLAQEWKNRKDLARLMRLSVRENYQRAGIGSALTQRVIDWCRDNGYRTLVLETTPLQKPALGLYRRFGFRQVASTFIGKYELIWHELHLDE